MPRPPKASMDIEYKDSVLEKYAELCPPTSIIRYIYDNDNWIEITLGERGVELRSNGADMMISPLSGNNIEVYLRDRK